MSGTVLVTGASGFVGRTVLEPLRDRGFEVVAPSSSEADLLDPATASALVARVRPTHLLHLAWSVEHGRFWSAPENLDWLAASLRLLRAFADGGGRRAVTVGTCAEYDWSRGGVLDEAGAPLRPATLYGAAKLALGDLGARHAEQAGVAFAHGRLFFLFGPGEHPDRLVASVARRVLAGERAPTTAGTQRRDFLAAAEAGSALAALVAGEVTGAVNVGSGEAVPIARIVSAIGEAAGRPDLVGLGDLPTRSGEPDVLAAAPGRLRDEVGWRPATTLEQTIADTVAWWRDHAEGYGRRITAV